MKEFKLALQAIFLLAICSCSSLPKFDSSLSPNPKPLEPRVSDIVDEIQCEILNALYDSTLPGSSLAGLQNGEYVANINLTLDVTDNEGVNPSLSYLSGATFTAAFNAQISGQQHRNFNVTLNVLFSNVNPTDNKGCPNENQGILGKLGIKEIIASGLEYETGIKSSGSNAYKMEVIDVSTFLTPTDPLNGAAALAPSFGSTVDFTVVYGLGGGPNWTLAHVTGLNPASGGLLSYMRTNKDTLIFSMAKVTPPNPAATPAASSDSSSMIEAKRDEDKKTNEYRHGVARITAAKAAQDNTTRMILQRLLLQGP